MISPVKNKSTECRVLSEFVSQCIPRKIRPIIEWAEEEIIVPSGPYEGYSFEADRLPYSRLLLEELGNWNRHVINGPTQSGKSFHAFVLIVMYYLFERQEDVIVGVPDMNMSGIKWSDDIQPVIAKSSYARYLPQKGEGSKGGQKVNRVAFGNGVTLTFMGGGGSDNQRAGATTRVLAVTEANKFDIVAETSQEGQTKIRQLEGRTKAYGDNAAMFFECTNTTADAFIWKEYELGSQSRIVHQCRSCLNWVSPEREHFIGWQDAEDEIEAEEKGCFTCPECSLHYSEDDRREMNQNAKLVHKGQEVTPDGEVAGPPPRTKTLGFRWSAFQNLLCSMGYIAVEEYRAKHSDNPETAEIAVLQQVWATPAENPNVEKVDISTAIVRGSEPHFRGRLSGLERGCVPENRDILTAFIDCGKRELQWAVEAKVDRHIHVCDYGVFETDRPDEKADEVAVSEAIIDLIEQLDGRFPDLHCGLVDAGNWSETVRSTVDGLSSVWHPSHGLPKYKHPLSEDADGKRFLPVDGCELWHWSLVNGVYVANFNPDYIKHQVHGGFLIRPVDEDGNRVSGSVSLFGVSPDEHTNYALEITAEEWRTEFKPGKGSVSEWHQVRKRNHYFDTAVGNRVARLVVKNWRLQVDNTGDQPAETEEPITTPDGRPFFVGDRA